MKQQAKIIILSFLVFAFSFSILVGFSAGSCQKLEFESSNNQSLISQTFGIQALKTYCYEITQNNSTFSVTSTYDDNEPYSVALSGSFENLIVLIDQDRFLNGVYQDCVINFNNIVLGNNYLNLVNGKYTLTGNLSGLATSTFGLIYINGANVEIVNAVLTNNGTSYLIRNDNSGQLDIINGVLTANDKTIFSTDGGNLNIFGGTIESKNSTVIFSTGLANITIQENSSLNPTHIIGNSQDFGTIYANNGAINILGGTITNNVDSFAVYSKTAIINLSCSPIFNTTAPHIYSETKLVGQIGGQYYSGEPITISYGGEIVSTTTVLVQSTNESYKSKFLIYNTGYDLKYINENLIIFATYSLIYDLNATDLSFLAPVDENDYFLGDTINIQFLETEIRLGYLFLGWSESSDAVLAAYTEQGLNQLTFSNQKLYAVWQAKQYTITYVLNGGEWTTGEEEQFNNPFTYETETFTVPNPKKTYYTFLGWTCENDAREQTLADTINNPNRIVEQGTIGNLTFTAHWELTVYSINYIGLTTQMISSLGLTTGFTIESPSITISNSNFLLKGYSFFGIYSDIAKTIEFNGEVFFDETAHSTTNPTLFESNGNVNFYVDTKIFHNGRGLGTIINPYKISTTQQFEAFLTGYKKPELSKTYIKFANDITFESQVNSQIFEPIVNFDINGDNYSIITSTFNTFDNYTSLFPYLRNCNLHNFNLKASNTLQVDFGSNVTINFASIVGLAEKTNLKNVNNFVNVIITNAETNQILSLQAGGIVCDFKGESSIIDNCKNEGNLTISLQNNNDINANCGMIAGLINDSMIINSCNLGEITLDTELSNSILYDTCLFVSGIAIMDLNSSIINSYNQGDITISQESKNLAVASGIGIIFNSNCNLYNNYNIGNISVKVANASNLAVPFVWSSSETYEIENCYSTNNYTSNLVQRDFTNGKVLRYLNSYLQALSTILENDFSDYSIQPKDWYYGFDLLPQFEETILVYYNLQGIGENKSVVYSANENISESFIPVSYRQNFFDGWFTSSSFTSLVDFDNLNQNSIALYAKWTAFDDYVNTSFVKYIVLEVLVLLLFLAGIYLFDKKKTVNFFNNGKLIATTKIARTKQITIPNGYESMVWFEDIRGQKPFVNKKMPYKKLSLYTFNDSKQQRMESKYYQALDAKNQEILRKAQEKQRQLEERQARLAEIKKQNEIKKAEAKKNIEVRNQAKAALKEEKQNKKLALQQNKTEQQKNINAIDDKITIIKKEIKIIKTNEDK